MCWNRLIYPLFLLATLFTINDAESVGNNIFGAVHDILENNTSFLDEKTYYAKSGATISEKYFGDNNNIQDLSVSEEIGDVTLNYTVPWNIFIALLMQDATEQLSVIKHNINTLYGLNEADQKAVGSIFENSDEDFESILMKKHTDVTKDMKVNSTRDLMTEFVEFANFLLRKVVSFNLDVVKGSLDAPSPWQKQNLRDYIGRQQSRNSTNYIQFHVCKVLSVCKEKTKYSEYAIEWIRHVFALNRDDLRDFFIVVPQVLKARGNFISYNDKLKNTLKRITNSSEMVQRAALDFLDEVISKRERSVDIVPIHFQQAARSLSQLFYILDEYYDLDDANEKELEDVSDILAIWKFQDINVYYVLEGITDNMKLNIVDWPADVRQKIEYLWHQVIIT